VFRSFLLPTVLLFKIISKNTEPSAEGEAPTASEIAFAERMWVKRGRNAAVVVTLTWVAWVIIVQVLATDLFPVSWFVRTPDQGEYTGW
jgi:hypothetical protein